MISKSDITRRRRPKPGHSFPTSESMLIHDRETGRWTTQASNLNLMVLYTDTFTSVASSPSPAERTGSSFGPPPHLPFHTAVSHYREDEDISEYEQYLEEETFDDFIDNGTHTFNSNPRQCASTAEHLREN
jgi:hypothetical protein